MRRLSVAMAALCAATLPALAQSSSSGVPPENTASASLISPKGEQLGNATLKQTPHGVLISVELQGIAQGPHGFHIHETGKCDPADGFKSAGGHYNPQGKRHGLLDPAGPHAGDMPNQFVGPSGTLSVQVLNTFVTLEPGTASLFDEDGSALMVHSGPDDYTSQPAGEAGERVACGVIERP
ncbi:superoxide dismutase family protein [Ancylobacter sp. IITR112]|uniref:superoxide dismutase family protein n=1 Tax=Ancylobacter sp. IITR112 TaxID=3138073 RepID=UPI00352ABFAA